MRISEQPRLLRGAALLQPRVNLVRLDRLRSAASVW
jgi:hypothetical protein